ncbi:MAG: hypothetical protein WA705_11015 [Candidatus Ozemobacteraceae bacterium]
MMRRIFFIAGNCFLDVARHKMISIHFIFLLIVLGLFNLFGHYSTTPDLEYKMIQDIGISVISLFGLLMAMFIGVATLREDLVHKTAYTVLTLPMARWEFYLGKFFGTLFSVALNVGIMICVFAFLLFLKFGTVWTTFFWIILFNTMELAIISSLVLLFSLSDSTILAFSFTFFFVILGNLATYITHLIEETGIETLSWLAKCAFVFIPNFGLFNIKARILKNFALSPHLVGWAVGYCILYLLFTVGIGIIFMERRDL